MPKILSALLILAISHAIAVLFLGFGNPLLDLHSFRQTQTALSAYWILKGGAWLAYETPVVGAPWAIPFEFPIYQLLAAGLAKSGLPLDGAGRIVTFTFFLASLWPLRILFDELRLGRVSYLTTSILFVASPLYLYWSRTFMIESSALFFALLWLSLFVRFINRGNWKTAGLGVVSGCLAVLAKATTFPAFAVVACIVLAFTLLRRWREGESYERLARHITVAAVLVAVPFAVGFSWVAYSDNIKMANQFGAMLTSKALSGWNFGSLQQRFSIELWDYTIWRRVIPDTLGFCFLAAFAMLAAAATSTRSLIAAAVALLAFLVPFLTFSKLHIVHNYYQYANALFLVVAVGLGIGRLFETGWRKLAVVAVLLIASGQIWFFYERFAIEMTRDYSNQRLLRISEIARATTQPGQSLIVIGDDWASTVPYLTERKSLVLAGWFPEPLLKQVFAEPQRFLGDQKFGGIVYCIDQLPAYRSSVPAVEAFVAGRTVLGEFGGCQFLAP
jgi:hypothetical protein